MPTHNDNKYTVHQRLADLTSRVTELEAENKRLRVHLAGELKTAVSDAKNVIQSSIRTPVDGKDGAPGRDGIDGGVGPQGPRGDVLIPNETELQQAVIALRRKLLEQRAAFVGRILQGIKDNESSNKVQQHYAKLLQYMLQDIERLQ